MPVAVFITQSESDALIGDSQNYEFYNTKLPGWLDSQLKNKPYFKHICQVNNI